MAADASETELARKDLTAAAVDATEPKHRAPDQKLPVNRASLWQWYSTFDPTCKACYSTTCMGWLPEYTTSTSDQSR